MVVEGGEEQNEWGDEGKTSLTEVISDADYAGQQSTTHSVSSAQVFLKGNMMESFARCQKSISIDLS